MAKTSRISDYKEIETKAARITLAPRGIVYHGEIQYGDRNTDVRVFSGRLSVPAIRAKVRETYRRSLRPQTPQIKVTLTKGSKRYEFTITKKFGASTK